MIRLLLTLCRLVGPYWYAPWRSPLLRWRLETYGIVDAQGRALSAADITPGRFLRFSWMHRRSLRHFLQWSVTFSL